MAVIFCKFFYGINFFSKKLFIRLFLCFLCRNNYECMYNYEQKRDNSRQQSGNIIQSLYKIPIH